MPRRHRSEKFTAGDETDRQLIAALTHEMIRCQAAFERFSLAAGRNVMGARSLARRIECHDAYSDFVRHLYEFYVACFQRDQWDAADIDASRLDRLFNGEAEKLLRRKREAIEHGQAPDWENDLSVSQVAVPPEFGQQFRRLRNANSHTSTKRVAPGKDWSLIQFFDRCHLFVHLLYQCQVSMWTGADSAGDWGEIARFDLSRRR
jgi:hypothetical protein